MDGLLAARENDGLGAVLDEVAQGRRRVGHGVGAMADHKPVVFLVVLLHRPDDHQPMLGGHVGGVDVAHLEAVHMAELLHRRDVLQEIRAAKAGA